MTVRDAMRSWVAALALAGAWTAAGAPLAGAQEVVFVVRHAEAAEDGTRDPELAPAGEARAAALARLLERAGVTAVYTSEMRRTQATAAPLARALRIRPRVVPGLEVDALVARLRAEHPAGRVLVVGHSNTVPRILASLGHPEPVEIGHAEHDALFVVSPRDEGPPLVVRLRLAAATGVPDG